MGGVEQKRMASDYMVYFGSPLKGQGSTREECDADFARNVEWARERCRDLTVKAGVTPYAPHAFFPYFLNDGAEEERWAGMACGLVTLKRCNESVFYLPPWRDGVSGGMKNDATKAAEFKVTVHNVRSEREWAEYLYNLRQRVLYAPQIRVA